ncbi:MAG: 50S ribosomal protein L44e [Nanoarchaeota archaeon]|nr:50S ribosomal protein L44e [Nanoarchaeota archaeon]|tara:strand:- start:6052 stop:6357 length:306 start_codon:yes stop_codon:yes gene_type:complete
MKIVKAKKRYCPKCKKHTEHKMSQVKSGNKRGTLKRGSIQRAQNRSVPGTGNKNRWGSKPNKPKRTGAKTSKKSNFKYTCNTCKKSTIQKQGIRSKKIEQE